MRRLRRRRRTRVVEHRREAYHRRINGGEEGGVGETHAVREALAEFVSTRYYSSKLEFYLAVSLVPLCSCIAVATLLLSHSCFCSPLPSSLSFFFVRDARIYTLSRSSFTYARSLDSLRSSFSLCRLSRLQCALSFSLSSSSSLFSTFAPSVASPGSLVLSLSLSLSIPLWIRS